MTEQELDRVREAHEKCIAKLTETRSALQSSDTYNVKQTGWLSSEHFKEARTLLRTKPRNAELSDDSKKLLLRWWDIELPRDKAEVSKLLNELNDNVNVLLESAATRFATHQASDVDRAKRAYAEKILRPKKGWFVGGPDETKVGKSPEETWHRDSPNVIHAPADESLLSRILRHTAKAVEWDWASADETLRELYGEEKPYLKLLHEYFRAQEWQAWPPDVWGTKAEQAIAILNPALKALKDKDGPPETRAKRFAEAFFRAVNI